MRDLVTRTVLCVVMFVVMFVMAAPGCLLFAQQTEEKKTTEEKKAAEEKKIAEEGQKVSEEIVVTARKREETVQDVPISVAAPTESELRDRGAETIEDVAANVAGFTVQNLGPGQSQVAMRGVSSGQIVRDQPGVKEQVGVYLDESVISVSLFTPDIDLFDMSRIEVLRGPQGTLFGSGSLSGTVRYISNQPKFGVSESVGDFTLGSIDGGGTGGSAKAAVNVPFGDTAAMRVAAYYTRYGGYMDAVQPNLSVKKNVNNGDRTGARVAFGFKPSEKLTITPRILYQKVKMNGWNRIDDFNILANPFTTTRPAVTLGDRRQFTQIKEPFDDKFFLGDLNLSYDLGGKTLTSISSYTDRDVLVVRDAGALTSSITGGSIGLKANVYTLDSPLDDKTKAKAFTQEVRLSGATPKLQWLTGAFYADTDRKYGQSLLVSGFETASGIPTRGLRAPKDVLFFSDLSYQFRQFALFGEGTYSVTDRLDLTGGLRYYDFKEDRDQVFDGIFGNDDNGKLLVSTSGSTKATGIAPRVIAGFKMNDNTRLNAQISKGFRLGGINDPLNVPLCTAQDLITFGGRDEWKDEELWNYEVGSKSRIFGNRGSLNVSAYYMDIKNLQATVTAGSCSSRVIFNVPKARTTGAELEFEIAPSSAFDFAISASHNNSKLRSTVTSTDKNGVVSVVAGIKEGNRLPTVPENQAAAAATFHWVAKQNLAGYVTAAYQYVGSRFTQIGDQAAGFGTVNLNSFGANTIGGPLTQSTFRFNPELPAYDILNLRFGILKNRWDTALFINNLTDERALLALDQERGTRARVGYLTNQPRTIGISTRINF
ncbi:MAG TPA: TonB-dependent receptor [Thermoanaerobaculia bacterium]|nr:TonB-dependent receptor [Thermoanaerobaculia bacterium]